MKILLYWPGATIAVADVASGLAAGLSSAPGVEVLHYRTDEHIPIAGHALLKEWQRLGKPDPKPRIGDILYRANQGILEVALRHLPDWVVMTSGMYQHPDYVVFLKRAGFRVALVTTESPYDIGPELLLARYADAVFTCERTCVPVFQTVCDTVRYLPHAWHPKVHQVAASDEDVTVPAHDVVFVGTGFQDRVDLLGAVDWSGIDFGLYGAWASLPSRHPLRRHLRGNEQPNTTTAQLYRRATVGLNLHRRAQSFGKRTRYIVRAESMNPRCYELAACGLPFVTDARAEVADVFGDSVWTFTDADDLGAKVRELLGNPAARAACVEGARRAVASHHWLNRAQWVLAALKAPANLARTA